MRIVWLGVLMLVFALARPAVSQEPPIGLAVGDKAVDFTAPNHLGEDTTLSDGYQDGPLVLILYRGGWCYYCNLQLQDYQSKLDEFKKHNVSILAVSVDKVERANQTVTEHQLGFPVISNADASILENYRAVYQVPDDLVKKYKEEYQIDLEEASGRSDHVIAVPATYVIDQNGTIVYAHTDIDYKIRKSAEEILAFIQQRFP